MCDPVSLAVLAVTASGAQAYEQRQQVKAMHRAINNEADSQNLQTAELQRQINVEANEEMSERAKAARIERARLRVAAGEAGVAGATSRMLIQDSHFNEALGLSNIRENLGNRQKQAHLEARSGHARLKSQRAQYRVPSGAATVLKIASDGAGAYYAAKPSAPKS
jgi:hypothetical protein